MHESHTKCNKTNDWSTGPEGHTMEVVPHVEAVSRDQAAVNGFFSDSGVEATLGWRARVRIRMNSATANGPTKRTPIIHTAKAATLSMTSLLDHVLRPVEEVATISFFRSRGMVASAVDTTSSR